MSALETVIGVLHERAEHFEETGEHREAGYCEGFAAFLEGEHISDRGFDDTSHHWKKGWLAAREVAAQDNNHES